MRKQKILLVLAEGFEEIEAITPIDILRRLEFPVTVAGLDSDRIRGSHGVEIGCDTVLSAVPPGDFAAIVLPGGMPGSLHLLESELVRTLLTTFAAAGKFTCAICAAPMVLAQAGLLATKRFTIYPGVKTGVSGVTPVPDPVVRDGSVITGNGPGAATAFALAIAAALGAEDALPELKSGMLLN